MVGYVGVDFVKTSRASVCVTNLTHLCYHGYGISRLWRSYISQIQSQLADQQRPTIANLNTCATIVLPFVKACSESGGKCPLASAQL
jgi:hypothetical protein